MRQRSLRRAVQTGSVLLYVAFVSAAWGASGDEAPNGAPITGCGVALNKPGTYTVGQDLSTSVDIPCITIAASNVTLLLGSHTISGAGAIGTASALIVASANLTGITIVGGTLKSAYIGLSLVGLKYSAVERVKATQDSIGFQLTGGFGSSFISNSAKLNQSHGFLLNGTFDNLFSNNFSNGNGVGDPAADGFYLAGASQNFFYFNEPLGNSRDGIQVSAGSAGNILNDGTFTSKQGL